LVGTTFYRRLVWGHPTRCFRSRLARCRNSAVVETTCIATNEFTRLEFVFFPEGTKVHACEQLTVTVRRVTITVTVTVSAIRHHATEQKVPRIQEIFADVVFNFSFRGQD
jgi:hypothetical protein